MMKKYIIAIALLSALCVLPVSVRAMNLVAHYEFENNLTDSAGAWDGTALGTIGYAASGCAGGNHCLEITSFGDVGGIYDGVIIEGSENLLDAEGSMTVSFWYKAKKPSTAPYYDIFISKINGFDASGGWRTRFTGSPGNVIFDYKNGASHLPQTSGATVNDGRWHHLVFSYAAKSEYTPPDANSRGRIYIDGVQVANEYRDATEAIISSSGYPITIGIEISDTGYEWVYKNGMYGWIDDVRLYDDFLTTTEIQALYASTLSVPVITTQPQSQIVDAGNNITFDVNGTGVSSYVWYKSPDPTNTTPGDDVPVGTDSKILTINNVQEANEGYYYCVLQAVNDLDDVVSDTAMLLTKRLVSKWEFEDNLEDSNDVFDGTRTNTSVYVTGIKAGTKALHFAANKDDRVVVPFTPKHNVKSFTVSAWAKAATDANLTTYGAVVSTRNIISSTTRQGYLLFAQPLTPNWVWSSWLGVTSTWSKVYGPSVTLNNWTLLTSTYDDTTKEQNLYINGVRYASATLSLDFAPNTARDLFIGCGNNETTPGNPFKGDIDDVRYYSYVLSPQEIAQLYVNISGEPLCVSSSSEYDYNHDCIVNFKDFAEFAENWLMESGMVYPQ